MNRQDIVKSIIEDKVVAVVRLGKEDDAMSIIEAIYNGGIRAIEVTMTTPGALELIKNLTNLNAKNLLVGVGSVLDEETAQKAIDFGAKYVVSPILDINIIKLAHQNDVAVMPGCFTPTEIYEAKKCGADIIKVFPADVLGKTFFKAVRAPIPSLKLMPTGGVTLTNGRDWLKAGACAVGIGSALIDKKLLSSRNYKQLRINTEILLENIKDIKNR
ncbi:MAG: 2-dehydro-3-deoxyphosphogluconate aldolase [Ignavibacteriae bacterium]|nr:MAG: 2-dehydro-3-deoxyphosphogluconate aldolase [Ignavibacteriota bacterium]